LYSSIVQKTPVDTGRARANWNLSCGRIDNSINPNAKEPRVKTEDDINVRDDETIYISNNLPYIETLEYGGYPSPVKKGTYVKTKGKGHYEKRSRNGFSKQAPKGMVGLAVAESSILWNQAIKEL
jgi:hypothetical protein